MLILEVDEYLEGLKIKGLLIVDIQSIWIQLELRFLNSYEGIVFFFGVFLIKIVIFLVVFEIWGV